jgi:hypothetical protein
MMKAVDPVELMRSTIVTHALVRAILNELGTHVRERVYKDALRYLPLLPDPVQGQLVNEAILKAARTALEELAAHP